MRESERSRLIMNADDVLVVGQNREEHTRNVEDDHLYFGESLVEVGGIENRRNDVEYDGGGQAKKVSYRSQEYGTR